MSDEQVPGREALHGLDTTLDRRDLFRLGAAGGLALGGVGCQSDAGEAGEAEELARDVGVPPFELDEVTVGELQEQMASGERSSLEIVRAYLGRIESLNFEGPELRCVIETNPEAESIAEALDRERSEGRVRGPLHGVPVLLKDNIDTADRMTTTAGSYALEGSIPPRDSFVAERLRAAGAVLLGKANLSEWANIRSSGSSSGWSGRGGQCRNPYALDRNPCGSSSGSGAAVSANLCALAVGTETDGSIVCPSNACGVVGVKPTVGLVSRAGVIPISHSQDTAGPMTRTVADAAHLLGALAGVDPRDPATAQAAGKIETDYTPFLQPDALAGARIGVLRQTFGFHAWVDQLLEAALVAIDEAGATLIDPVEIPSLVQVGEHEIEVLLYELKHDLNLYLASLGEAAPIRTLEEVIRFNQENPELEMPFFGQDLFEQAQGKGPLTEQAYLEALSECRRLTRSEGLGRVFDGEQLDAIVAPTGGPAWLTDHVNGDSFLGGSSTGPAVAGYPNVTVPAGFVSGLPVGISIMGPPWSEGRLLGFAYAFEQATRHRQPPRFLPSVEVA